MRHVEVFARVEGLAPAEVFAIISDFARYPEHSKAVRSVTCKQKDGGQSVSAWEVNFREGVLRWTEVDVFNVEERTIHFRQIEGDVDYFAGVWSVRQASRGCLVCFECDFDMGIPGLNDILEPIAEQALRENARSILGGLIPSIEFVDSADDGKGGRP
jgi:ribosome-associated toxin RatA of RatAB toxin-antitoxin module